MSIAQLQERAKMVAALGVSFDGTNTAVRTRTFGYRCPRACGPDRVGGTNGQA
jgi:hypothetical protein